MIAIIAGSLPDIAGILADIAGVIRQHPRRRPAPARTFVTRRRVDG
jgi:hypothetical protein